MRIHPWLLPLLFLLISEQILAQSPVRFDRMGTENLRIEKGLSQNTVNCIFQDSKGFLWFGTWDGLNMYDGYRFTIYKPDLFGPDKGISNQTVTSIAEDKQGVLWIGTEMGLNRFDRHTRTFTKYLRKSDDVNSLSSDTINYLLFDKMGNLWVATENGLNRMDMATGTFTRFMPVKGDPKSLSNPIVRWLYEDFSGNIWAASRAGINILNPKTDTFQHLKRSSTSSPGLQSDTIHCIVPGDDGIIWLGTGRGLEMFDPEKNAFNPFPALLSHLRSRPIPVNVVFVDGEKRLWAGTQGEGLRLYEAFGESFTAFKYASDDPNSLSDDYVLSIFEDRSKILWVGTNWKGVNKVSDNTVRFDHYYHRTDDNNSLNNNLVWSITEDLDERLWIATDLGVNILDRKTGKFSFLRPQPGNPNSLVSDKVSAIFRDSKGYMWVGSFDKGVSRFDIKANKYLNFATTAPVERRLPDDDIGAIIEDRFGNIWLGTGAGLVRINAVDYKTMAIPFKPGSSNSLFYNHITCLFEDSEGYIWVGTYRSLERYDPATGRFVVYRHSTNEETTLSSDVIYTVFEDSKGRFWIGTRGGGLNLMDRKSGTFKSYTETDGLPNNVVYAVLEDNEGNLWMSTNYGLSVFDPERITFVNFDVRDGLQSNEFNLGAAYKRQNGEMFFGGMHGFNAFLPERIRRNTTIPQMAVPQFQVFNQRLARDLDHGDIIKLNFDENSFSILFSALDFTNPARNLYSYTLEKIDKGWINTDGSKRFAEYTRVPPGTYLFKVKGSNNDGVWNETPFSLTIIIAPPWYATWLFRVFVVFAATALLGSSIWLRFKRIERRHRMEKKVLSFEKQLIDIRQKALRLQMNPHFIFNSLNSIQSFILSSDIDKAIHYLSKFSQLMRQILSNSNETFIPLSEELKALEYYMDIERLRFDNKFSYEFILPEGLDDEFIEIPPMIVQPYIENAIIHGLVNKPGPGRITIRMKVQNDLMHWEVEDDGIGREASRKLRDAYNLQRKSRGMMITRQRLEVLNTGGEERFGVKVIDIRDENDEACGTRVIIDMPIKEA